MKLKAYNWSPVEQSLLDIGIKLGAAIVILVLNTLSSAVSNGTLVLPDAAFTGPILALILSQLDSTFVAWSNANHVALPQ